MRLMLFTDGSARIKYTDKTKKVKLYSDGGWAFLLTHQSKTTWYRLEYDYSDDTTISRMELTAVIRGLQYVLQGKIKAFEVIVFTDSQYVKQVYDYNLLEKWPFLGWITTEGTPVANQDLWEELSQVTSDLQKQGTAVRYKKVKAHSGDRCNDFVDNAAVNARKRKRRDYANFHILYNANGSIPFASRPRQSTRQTAGAV